MKTGIIKRIKGPIVVATGISGIELGEVVEVGEERLIGEVVRLSTKDFTIQVYEPTDGLKPGEKVYATGKLLVSELGPGLIGNIFDGLQRPLKEIMKRTGPFIKRGVKVNALDRSRKWYFKPVIKKGATVEEGSIIGIVQETSIIEHKIMIPPGIRGEIVRIEEGEFRVDDVVAVVKDKKGLLHEITLRHEWPVRKPRPFKLKYPPREPLITGQRVIDSFFPIAKGGT